MSGPIDVALADGTPGTVPAAEVGAVKAQGGRVMSAAEVHEADREIAQRNAPVTPGSVARDYGDMILAGEHGLQRGIGEAVGVPVDTAAVGVAGLFGGQAANRTRSYLRGLEERHPYLSAATGLEGNVAGAIGAAAALKAPGAIGTAPMRGAAGVAARMGYGGVENVVQASTHDINESTLGDHAINGEKLVAQMPKHFLVGAAFTGLFEGGAAALEKGMAKAVPKATAAADASAARLVGREVGDETAGGRILALSGGEVPKSRTAIADLLTAEQGAQRGAAAARHTSMAEALSTAQIGEESGMALRHARELGGTIESGGRGVVAAERGAAEGSLEAAARGGERVEAAELGRATQGATAEALHAESAKAASALNAVTDHYEVLRQTLAEEHRGATKAAQAIETEMADNAKQLERALERAEKQSGVKPGAGDTMASIEAHEAAREAGQRKFDADVGAKIRKAGEAQGTVTQEHPALLKLHQEAFGAQRAARVEGATVLASRSTAEEVTRLHALGEQLQAAHREALDHVGTIEKTAAQTEAQAAKDVAQAGQRLDRHVAGFQKAQAAERGAADAAVEGARRAGEKEVAKAGRKGAAGIVQAHIDAEAARVGLEKTQAKEHAALKAAHLAADRKLPKLSTKTDVDILLRGLRSREAEVAAMPTVSGGAMLGAAAMHGNPVAAASALAGSFAAGKVRTEGNLLRARALRGLSDRLTAVDDAVRKGAARILGKSAATASAGIEREVETRTTKQPTFEQVSKNLVDAQANPGLVEHRVAKALGHIAKDAPDTYQEVVASTLRGQAYLTSLLPPPQRDPHSLTPHLVPGDTSEAAKYDFMQTVRTVDDPLSIFQDVLFGTVTEQQVDSIAKVYPLLYGQMQDEVRRQTLDLKEPIPYEREIHVGTLLGVMTDEVLEPDFQRAIRDSYEFKADQGKPMGSKPGEKGPDNNTMKSTSQQVESGMSP